jgi:hypothetical protein
MKRMGRGNLTVQRLSTSGASAAYHTFLVFDGAGRLLI